MITCCQEPIGRFRSTKTIDLFQTSYKRSHYYETSFVHPMSRAHLKRKLPEDLSAKKSILDNYTSVHNKTYDVKFTGFQAEHYGRSSAARNPNLKSLHEKYVSHIIKPIKPGLTITGLTYVSPKKPLEPLSLPFNSVVDDATCSISSFDRDSVPSIPPNEPGAHKHLDNFVSTTYLTHVNFTTKQRNGLPKNDVVTYYDTTESRCHLKTIPPIGPYFPRCDVARHSSYPKTFRTVPYKGYRSTYRKDYDHTAHIPILSQPKVQFPLIFKLSRNEVLVTPAMYCTEQSHVGSGSQSNVV